MCITTILPPAGEKTLSRVVEDVLSCLRRRPMMPLDLRVIADNIAGVTLAQAHERWTNSRDRWRMRETERPRRTAACSQLVHICFTGY